MVSNCVYRESEEFDTPNADSFFISRITRKLSPRCFFYTT